DQLGLDREFHTQSRFQSVRNDACKTWTCTRLTGQVLTNYRAHPYRQVPSREKGSSASMTSPVPGCLGHCILHGLPASQMQPTSSDQARSGWFSQTHPMGNPCSCLQSVGRTQRRRLVFVQQFLLSQTPE